MQVAPTKTHTKSCTLCILLIAFLIFCADSVMASDAEFIGENIRDESFVFYGEKFKKKWTFKNISTTAWTTGYCWQFVPSVDEPNKSISTYNCYCLKNEVPPGSDYTFEVEMVVPTYGMDNIVISEDWKLVDDQGNDVPGASGFIKVEAVNCPISNSFTYPVGYAVLNVEKQPYEVWWDFVDKYYDVSGWHQSEDWNGLANGGGETDERDPVYSIGYGYVVYNGPRTGLGNVVLIRHVRQLQNGEHEPLYSRYSHLRTSLVKVGDIVHRGEIIAELGGTGGYSPHLDFGIMKDRIFTVESRKSICKIKTPNGQCEYFEPIDYEEAAGQWVGNPKTSERKDWIIDNYYNPFDHTVNTENDGEGHNKRLEEFDEGNLFFNGNQQIIVDDEDTNFTKIGGNWDTPKEDEYRHYYKFPTNSVGHSARWTPNIPRTGYYDVFAGFWCSPSEPEAVEYIVYDSNGGNSVGISQRQHNQTDANGDSKYIWYEVYLGTYHFLQGQHGYVMIENAPNANVDQMFFRPVEIYNPPDVKNISVSLIIDSSGSMSWNDPYDLRKEAAKIFVDSAHDNDSIAIIDFDSYASVPWHLETLTSYRSGIRFAIDTIDSYGGTDIRNGLIAGYNELATSSIHVKDKKAAVLLTDGVGYYSGEAEFYRDKNTGEIWPIYTIGLGYDTNPEMLKEIADKTCGKYFELTDPNQLQNVYFEIATQISGGTSLVSNSSNMTTGQSTNTIVTIPINQQSTTFLTSWPGSDVSTTLTTPSGQIINASTNDPNVYHAKGLTYELFRITNPEAGNWNVNLLGVQLAAGGEIVNLNVSTVGEPIPVDDTPPIISISNPIDGKMYFNQLPVACNFSIEDPESGILDQSASLNGVPINNNDEFVFNQLGENTLTITATNNVNLTSEMTIKFNVCDFKWLPPIKYKKNSETETFIVKPNRTLPIKFTVEDSDGNFFVDQSVKVVVQGTTAEFIYGDTDTDVRINEFVDDGEPNYIVNLHTNFKKWDYNMESGNEYYINVYFDSILAGRTMMMIK